MTDKQTVTMSQEKFDELLRLLSDLTYAKDGLLIQEPSPFNDKLEGLFNRASEIYWGFMIWRE